MKKVSLFFVSLALMLCLAFGMTACGKDKKPKDPPAPPAPPTPTVTVDVTEASLIQNEQITVTATVANSENAAAFSLATGGDTVVALQVSETTPNVAKLTALADGNTTLTVALEGAQSVTVPVQVDGKYRIIAAETLKDNQKVFDAGVTGEDDGETATISVKHFIDGAKVEYEVNGAAAEISTEKEVCTVMAHQAGVADVTVKIMVPKAQQPEQPDPEQPEAQAEEGDQPEQPEVEYEELHSETYTVVCTDDWNKLAEKEASTKLLSYKEVKDGETVIGYAAYIDRTKGEALDVQDSEGVLRVPAIYNRKPVVSLIKNQENIATNYFLAYEAGSKKTQEQIDAMETDAEKEKAEADNAAIDEYEAIYNEISELYLPCTLTSIPDLTFRLAPVTKIEVQKGNHIATIGVQAFNQIVDLESFNLVDCEELKTIREKAFYQAGQNKEWQVVMPNSVTLIEYSAFTQSGVTKIEFQHDDNAENAVTIQGDYATHAGNPEAGIEGKFGAFAAMPKLKELYLRNIKSIHGNAICTSTALEILSLDEKFTVATFAGDNFGFWGTYKPYLGTAIIFEGADNKLVKALEEDAATPNGLGENCRGLLENVFTSQLPTVSGNLGAVYISEEISDDDVAAVIKKLFTKQATSDRQGYTLWVRSAYLYAGLTDKVDEGHVNPWLPKAEE